MPKEITHIRVFVASPSDVAEERQILGDVIRKLNTIWADTLRIHLDLVKWETHTYPGVGDYAQGVINDQIGNDYDIFIGILWTRFGTPTDRADSGTAEEFQRAFKRYHQDPDSLRIMFYFKTSSPDSLDDIDLEQLASVRSFKKSLGEQGVYWWDFRDVEEFRHLVDMHLTRQVQDFGKGWGLVEEDMQKVVSDTTSPDGKQPENELAEAEDELGLLDYLEIGGDSFDLAKEIMDRIGTSSNEVSSKMTIGTDERYNRKLWIGLRKRGGVSS